MAQNIPVFEALEKEGYQFIFVTLTVENVVKEDVGNAFNALLKGFNSLLHHRKIMKSWAGVARSVEVTYNELRDDFHPHIHCLVAVDSKYFGKEEGRYINTLELAELWQKACKLAYTPRVFIEKVSNKTKGTLEVFKYALKPTLNAKALEAFYLHTKGKRLVSFTGVIARMRKEQRVTDEERNLCDVETNKINTTYDLYRLDVTGGVAHYMGTYWNNDELVKKGTDFIGFEKEEGIQRENIYLEEGV